MRITLAVYAAIIDIPKPMAKPVPRPDLLRAQGTLRRLVPIIVFQMDRLKERKKVVKLGIL